MNLSFSIKSSHLYILLLVAVFLIGYLIARVQSLEGQSTTPTQQAALQQNKPSVNNPQNPPAKVDVNVGSLPPLGNKKAKVTLIEFSDFQCQFCRRYSTETFAQIKKEYIDTGKIAYYFRHFPLDFHQAAMPSALAGECANDQGKFWEIHDKIFAEQAKKGDGTIEFTKDDIKLWAKNLGLNTNQFNSCLDTEKYKSKVEKDISDGKSAGVSGTPSFFVNGTNIVGAQPFSAFKTLIDQELAK
ncbi:MAG: DsbA family protein [Armatimonadetes bacterium]|nr:MAG: DsbA family protein [Armatimonadota bacterium]